MKRDYLSVDDLTQDELISLLDLSGCAPAEAAATSKETRVRVDGFSKTMATALPWSRPA